jgi:hypothetical protein
MMFKNRRVLISSVAIIFTLIVSAIVVNFTLASSGGASGSTSAETSATTSITGYSNIDLAIINSNDTSLKATGDDKYRIVQILPQGMSSYATADTAMTTKVTATGYKGTISSESDYASTSDLWKYVYDGEYFRYAVFNGYKTISTDMASGAVSLTTVTVDQINSMSTSAQEILSNADMIYICAMNYTDYIPGYGADLSEDLYNWLAVYATTDKHPLVIDYNTLCVEDTTSITGNNDTYRMGTLAYKVMTKTRVSRYDNVLVSGPVQGADGGYYTYFYSLFVEASNNKDVTGMTNTTKTISDFILRADDYRYTELNRYYKWYDEESFETFAGTKSAHADSAYVKAGSGSTGATSEKTSWDYDNAKILVITNGTSSNMYNTLSGINSVSGHPTADDYTYNSSTGAWTSVTKATNSDLTKALYNTGADGSYAYVPSGANIYRVKSSDLVNATTTGAKLDYSPSSTGYMDIQTCGYQVTITTDSQDALDGTMVYLLASKSGEETKHVVVTSDESYYAVELSDAVSNEDGEVDGDGNVISEGTYTYTVSFDKLDASYTYSVMLMDINESYLDGEDFIWSVGSADLETSSKYITGKSYYIGIEDAEATVDGYEFNGNDFVYNPSDVNFGSTYYDMDTPYEEVTFETADDVVNYVQSLFDADQASEALAARTSMTIDFEDFDFIFIEAGAYGDEIGNTVFNDLCTAVEDGVYVIVSNNAGDGIGSGSGSDDSDEAQRITINSPSAKALADIINSGVYRDGADNKFRVLEIQPDYPINLTVASTRTKNSAWETNSEGQRIVGDYYTVPSDVVEGKAQEEISPSSATGTMLNEEYYDFDLTKARIAYAIDGVSYEQVEITQVSTEALIGMTDDIAATYDLVYIGGDISALDRSVDEIYPSSIFSYIGPSASQMSKVLPTFIMYYHTGALRELGSAGSYKMTRASKYGKYMMATPVAGSTYYTTTYVAENGNDLTNSKYEELIEYINQGRPIMVSSELSQVYDNMNAGSLSYAKLMQGYWYNNGTLERKNYYLDPSSRMYKLLGVINTAKATSNSILWGIDTSDTTRIDNTDGTYGATLYTVRHAGTSSEKVYLDTQVQNQSWYTQNEAGSIKCYATVFSDDVNTKINNLVNSSNARTRLTVTTSPTAYKQGIKSTYISTTNLAYSFVVDGSASTYKYTLYVDTDKNTVFDSSDTTVSGVCSNSTELSVNLALDPEFFGSAYWKLEITDTAGNTVAEKTGISKIVNTSDGMSEINILQIQTMAEGQEATSWTATDTLYFDITSQTSHKICLYNTYANQVALDTVSMKQYTVLGRHENRFGILEYDQSIVNSTASGGGVGNDDYFSNLAEELYEDYDINLDMVVASSDKASFTTGDGVNATYDCFDTMVSEADKLANGGSVTDTYTNKAYTQAGYKSLVAGALEEYNNAAAAVDPEKDALDEFLYGCLMYMFPDKYPDESGNYTGYSGGYDYSKTYNAGFRNGFNGSMSDKDIEELILFMLDTGEYYMVYFPLYSSNTVSFDSESRFESTSSVQYGKDFTKLFIAYRDAKDKELTAKAKYNTYLRRSYGADFMKKMYSILVLGPSDSFGGFAVDMTPLACNYILDYVANGGDLFFFHDTMTPYADAGAVNLTKSLLSVVGMNRFHVDITDGIVSYDDSIKLGSYSIASVDKGTMGGIVDGTLTEDGYVYYYEWESHPSDAELVTLYYSAWGRNVNFYKAAAKAGTSGKIYKEVINDGTVTDVSYNSPDETLYYMTPYAFNTSFGTGIINSMNANRADYVTSTGQSVNSFTTNKFYISALSYTSLYYDKNGGGGKTNTLPYVFAQTDFQSATSWSAAANADQSTVSQSVNASQLNEGLITLYPFQISDTLNISGTHQQAYALDLESDNVTVWYTLAGSNNSSNAKIRSSLYAADPYDGMENYFIYTTAYKKGAITYCGAGHSSVTGKTTNNNDERRLFINVIINSAAAVKEKPSIKLYQPDEQYKTELDKDEKATSQAGRTVYEIDVDTKTDIPQFDTKISIPDGTSVTSIRFYYDGDYDDSDYTNRPGYVNNDKHKSIYYETFADGYTQTTWKMALRKATSLIAPTLEDTFFNWYGGSYTYLVVEVYYDGATKPVYAMIKIKASDPLFELTQNNTTTASLDAVAEKKLVF